MAFHVLYYLCWSLGEESDAYSYPTVTSGGEGLPMQEEIECIGNVAYSTSKASKTMYQSSQTLQLQLKTNEVHL